MAFKAPRKAQLGSPTSEFDTEINLQDPIELDAAEDFFTEAELEIDIADEAGYVEEVEFETNEDGFSRVPSRRYGEALTTVRRVNSPKSYGADGQEVDFKPWEEAPKREIVELEVPQKVIDQCSAQEDVKIQSIKEDSAAQLAADVRKCMAEFELNKIRQTSERIRLTNKRLMEENRQVAKAAYKRQGGIR